MTLDALVTAEVSDFDPQDALLVRAADELLDDRAPATGDLGRRVARYQPTQILELIILCGWYRTLSSLIATAALPPESWGRRFPSEGADARQLARWSTGTEVSSSSKPAVAGTRASGAG